MITKSEVISKLLLKHLWNRTLNVKINIYKYIFSGTKIQLIYKMEIIKQWKISLNN